MPDRHGGREHAFMDRIEHGNAVVGGTFSRDAGSGFYAGVVTCI